jgi:hypothetical protein
MSFIFPFIMQWLQWKPIHCSPSRLHPDIAVPSASCRCRPNDIVCTMMLLQQLNPCIDFIDHKCSWHLDKTFHPSSFFLCWFVHLYSHNSSLIWKMVVQDSDCRDLPLWPWL